MDYFAGLDISMDETHVCVVDRDGAVVYEGKSASMAEAIADELAKAPSCRRIVFETGRMAPILFHGLSQLGLPVVCVESRQAYQALKSLATHKTDRNDARGLAHLARTGFFKPVHVKSLSRPRRPLADHRAQEAGRATRDLGKSDPGPGRCVRGSASSRAHRRLHRSGSEGQRGDRWPLCRHAGTDCGANRGYDGGRVDRRRHEAHDESLGRLSSAHDNPRRRSTDRARLCRRNRRSVTHPPIARRRRLSGPGPKTLSVRRSRLCRRHLEMRRPAGADPAVRSRQRHADPLQGPAQAEGLGLRNRQAINHAQGPYRFGASSRNHHARHAAGRNRVPRGVGKAIAETGDRIQLPQGATTQGGSRRRRRFCRTRPTSRLRFQPRRPVPSLPHQAPASAQRTQASQGVENREELPPLTH